MAGLLDLFGGQQGGDYPGVQGIQNSLVGLGLGLMSGPTLAGALRGYEAGAHADVANRNAAIRARESAANRAQAERHFQQSYGLQREQFERGEQPKPQIITDKGGVDEEGNQIVNHYLFTPGKNGTYTYQQISPAAAGNLSPALGGGQQAPAAPANPMQQSDAVPFVDPTQAYGLGPEVGSPQLGGLPGQKRSAPPDVRGAAIAPYFKGYGTKRGQGEAEAVEKNVHGQRVQDLITRLEDQVQNPLFAQGAGPYAGAAATQPPFLPGGIPNPARLAYEYGPESKMGSTAAKNHLGVVQSTAQTINSELQAAYLKGQGSVTENERMQIDRILGNIAGARDTNAALANLKNLREIVQTTMSRPYGWQPPAGQRLWTPPQQQAAPQGAPAEPQTAEEWLQQNPNDPRAAAIRRKLGM